MREQLHLCTGCLHAACAGISCMLEPSWSTGCGTCKSNVCCKATGVSNISCKLQGHQSILHWLNLHNMVCVKECC